MTSVVFFQTNFPGQNHKSVRKLQSIERGNLSLIPEFMKSIYSSHTKTLYYVTEQAFQYIINDAIISEQRVTSSKLIIWFREATASKRLETILSTMVTLQKSIEINSSTDTNVTSPTHSSPLMTNEDIPLSNNLTTDSIPLSRSPTTDDSNNDILSSNCSERNDPLIKLILSLKPPPSNKFLSPVDKEGEVSQSFDWDESGKVRDFMLDCSRLGFTDRDTQLWYTNVIRRIDELMPDLNKVMDREIKTLMSSDHLNFSTLEEYRTRVPWAIRSALKWLLENKTQRNTEEESCQAKLKKIHKIYFSMNILMNIKNSHFIGPMQKQLGDILYTKHGDVNYIYNVLSHLSIVESLPSITSRQVRISKSRRVAEELRAECRENYVLLYDNFNKTKTVYDSMIGTLQTATNEILNRTLLGLSPVQPCTLCDNVCDYSWSNDKKPESIEYNVIWVNEVENEAAENFKMSK